MDQTITITTKSIAKELDKWQITNHYPFQSELLQDVTETDDSDKESFTKTLRKVSRKISPPVAETT